MRSSAGSSASSERRSRSTPERGGASREGMVSPWWRTARSPWGRSSTSTLRPGVAGPLRGPRFALLLAVDDATGAVVHALFGAVEDARGYFLLMKGVLRRSGVPLALYTDRHAVFRASAQQRAGRKGVDPVRAGDGGAGGPPDLRPLTAGQGPGGAHGGHVPGPPRDRTAARLSHHHRRGADRARALPPALQCPLRRRRPPARTGLAPARPGTRPRGHPRLQAHPYHRARQHRQVPLAHAAVAALTAAAQLRRGEASRCWSGPGGDLAVRHQGETIPSRLAPPRSGVLRERRSELALDPALERIASGLGPSGGPPRPQAHPATTNGTIVNAAAPTVLRSPTASQAARWKAIQQALLQGLSMRATARLLGISRNTIRRYVRAGGPPGRQDAASSTEQRPPKRTCSLNR